MRARRRENDYENENDFFRDGAKGGVAAVEQRTEAGSRPSPQGADKASALGSMRSTSERPAVAPCFFRRAPRFGLSALDSRLSVGRTRTIMKTRTIF